MFGKYRRVRIRGKGLSSLSTEPDPRGFRRRPLDPHVGTCDLLRAHVVAARATTTAPYICRPSRRLPAGRRVAVIPTIFGRVRIRGKGLPSLSTEPDSRGFRRRPLEPHVGTCDLLRATCSAGVTCKTSYR